MNINLEQTILRNLLVDEDYMRKVLPFVKPEYFEGVYKSLFIEVGKFVGKYNRLPNLEAFKIEIDDHKILGFRKRKNWISKSKSSISDKIEKETHTTLYIRKSIRIPDWMVRKLVSPGVFGQDKSRRY